MTGEATDLVGLTDAEMDDLDAFGISPRPSLPQLLREGADDLHPFALDASVQPTMNCALPAYLTEAATLIEAQAAEIEEARRRRDEWRKKAEGYDAVRRALREKIGAPWPPNLSRALWAGLAADQKKRANDAEADLAEALKHLEAMSHVAPRSFEVNAAHAFLASRTERADG